MLGRRRTRPGSSIFAQNLIAQIFTGDYDLPPFPTYPSTSSFPSSSTSLYSTPPPAKRARKAAPKIQDPDAPPPEKRLAIFKKKCPQNILERVHRVMQQRFFMVDRQRNDNELREEFSVLGSTGNVSGSIEPSLKAECGTWLNVLTVSVI